MWLARNWLDWIGLYIQFGIVAEITYLSISVSITFSASEIVYILDYVYIIVMWTTVESIQSMVS